MSQCSSSSCEICLRVDCLKQCDGCSAKFCFEHFHLHQRHRDDRVKQLKQRFYRFNRTTLTIDQHEQFIDQWEKETIESIRQHAVDLREKLRHLFQIYRNEINEFQIEFEENLQQTIRLENDLNTLASKIGQLERQIRQADGIFAEMMLNDLNEILLKSIRHFQGDWFQWKFLYEIPLSSTYGLIAANERQIILGWQNRFEIFDLNGNQLDKVRLNSLKFDGKLCDLIWSDRHQQFFILCEKSLFIYDDINSQSTLLSNIGLANEEHRFISISVYQDHLLILHNRSLDLWYSIDERFQFIESISLSSIVDDRKTENICQMRSNNKSVVFLIQNDRTKMFRFDTFDLFPFRRCSKGIEFDHFIEKNLAVFAFVTTKIALFFNWENQSMRRIDFSRNSNYLIQCNIYNACRVGHRTRLVLNAMTHLKVFQLQL